APQMGLLFDQAVTNGAGIKLLPQQQLLVAAGDSLTLWSFPDAHLVHEERIPDRRVLLISINESADLVAAADDKATLRLYRLQSLLPVHTISMAHTQVIRDLQFNADGSRLVSAGADSFARVWESKTGKCFPELRHDAAVYSAAFSPDGT